MEESISNMDIRKAELSDAAAICGIYNYYIENTAVTFETVAIEEAEMKERISDIINSGFPYYVIEVDGKIAGYYYVNRWKDRCAYSSTKEVTIYLQKDMTGKGLGSLLFEHLLKTIDRENTHVLLAGICTPNEGSVKLHEKFGFKQVSHMKQIGRKFDKWQDVGHWELILND